jgi:hypothetical protein
MTLIRTGPGVPGPVINQPARPSALQQAQAVAKVLASLADSFMVLGLAVIGLVAVLGLIFVTIFG